jgi:hypothetical protein
MRKPEQLRLTIVLIVLALFTVVCASGGGEESAADPITAKITELSGKVQLQKASVGEFKPAIKDTLLFANDQVLTGEDGRARIDLENGTIIRLSPLSNFVLKQIGTSDQNALTRLQLNIGRLWIILNGGELEVDTPSGMASVRGSYLHVWVDPLTEFTNITCLEGICRLENAGGNITLVAGHTASIKGAGNAPQSGRMSHTDVAEWLNANPEATEVVVPLTQTVAAGKDTPLPEAKTLTPTPTATFGPSATPTVSPTPTKTLLAVDCGPPSGWVLHTIREGETLDSISALYRVTVAELQKANCRGEMTFIVPGEKFYVPNVATSTPTNTLTPTPTVTKTPTVTGTITDGTGGTSPTATNSPTTLSGIPVGPDKTVISTVSMCPNAYKIPVVDPDGIKEVKMIYTFDGSLPSRDAAVSAGRYILLPKLSGDVYGVSGRVIDTTGQTAPVTIKFRFAVMDTLGNLTYFPASTAYTLTDQVNCSAATSFSNESGPSGSTITDPANCQQTFQIDATDPDGIVEAKLLYNVDNSTPNWSTSVAAGDYYTLTKSGSTYSVTTVIDSSVGTSDVIRYVYAVKDGLGNIYHHPATGDLVYTDTVNCGQTTWNTPVSPDGLTINAVGMCSQTYSIVVNDANGVSKVEVQYTISDGIASDKAGKFALPLNTGSTYLKTQVIDTSTGGFGVPTVTFDFKAMDNLGHWTTMFSGSFTDTYLCP